MALVNKSVIKALTVCIVEENGESNRFSNVAGGALENRKGFALVPDICPRAAWVISICVIGCKGIQVGGGYNRHIQCGHVGIFQVGVGQMIGRSHWRSAIRLSFRVYVALERLGMQFMGQASYRETVPVIHIRRGN